MAFFGFLGPFLNLYTLIIAPCTNQRYLMSNTLFGRLQLNCFLQTGLWFINIWMWAVVLLTDSQVGDITTSVLLLFMICLRSSSIAAKYATFHPNLIKKVEQRRMEVKEIEREHMLGSWFDQKAESIELEIDSTMKRNQIDNPLFKLNFLAKISKTKKLEIKQIISQHLGNSYTEAGPIYRSVGGGGARGRVLVYHDAKILFEFLVKKFNEKSQKKTKKMMTLTFLVFAPAFCFLPGYIRALSGQTFHGRVWYELVAFYLTSADLYMLIVSFIIFFSSVVVDMRRRAFLLTQLGHMISAEKQTGYSEEKLLPTINLVDPMSLSTWMKLRRLALDYGGKYFLRHQIFLPVVLFYCVLAFFGELGLMFVDVGARASTNPNIKTEADKLLMLLLIIFWSLFIFLVALLYQAAFVNLEFETHIGIFTENLRILKDLLKYKEFYFWRVFREPGADLVNKKALYYDQKRFAVKDSTSFVHKRLAREISDILGVGAQRCAGEDVGEYLRELVETTKECIADLEALARFKGLTLLGFEILPSSVNNFVLAFVSISLTCFEIFSK